MIWEKYEKCNQYLTEISLVDRTSECWDFYLDNPWNIGQNRVLNTGGVNLPFYNIIKSSVKFQTSTIAQNMFTPTIRSSVPDERSMEVAGLLNKLLYSEWKESKQRSRMWDIIKHERIQGESYQYCGTDDPKDDQIIHNTDIMFGDEGNPDIQTQPYIIIRERMLVSEVKRIAEENGIPKSKLEILPGDKNDDYLIGDHQTDIEPKVTAILYLEKKDGVVHYARAVEGLEFQPLRPIQSNSKIGDKTKSKMTLYPIAKYMSEEIPYSARGKSAVRGMIPNQIEINKTLVRRSEAVKIASYPRLAYNANVVQNEEDLDKAGAKIALDGMTDSINQNIAYLNPMSMSSDASNLQADLIQTTRTLNGSNDAITGATDPTRVSGAAVIAMSDQSALSLTESVQKAKQFVEDLTMIWLDLKKCYKPNGFLVDDVEITGDELQNLEAKIEIDVSNESPWTINAEQAMLDNALANQFITFEEYVDLSPDKSVVPKSKFAKLFEKRKGMEDAQMQMRPDGEVGQIQPELMGGELPQMR